MTLLFGLGSQDTQQTDSNQKSGGLLFGLGSNQAEQPAPQQPAHFVTKTITNALGLNNTAAPAPNPKATVMSQFPKLGETQISSVGYKPPASITGSEIRSAPSGYQPGNYDSRFSAPVSSLPWYMRPGRVASDVIKTGISDFEKRGQELVTSFMGLQNTLGPDGRVPKTNLSTKQQTVENVTKATSLGLGIVNLLFTPISGALKGSEEIPGVNFLTKPINKGFEKLGEVGSTIGDGITNKLPVSDETKNKIRPVMNELFATLVQFGAGAAAHELVSPKVDSLTKTISKEITNDSVYQQKLNEVSSKVGIEQNRAPSVLQVTNAKTGESTMQAIKPEQLEAFKALIDNGDTNKAQMLQDKTGNSYHLTATPVERMSEAGVKPVQGYAMPEDIQSVANGKTAPIEGTGGTKPRGLSLGVEQSAIANKLTTGFADIPEYKTMNIQDQATKASDLLKNDYESAKRIALGEVPAPQGLHPEAVYTAVELRATKEGDVSTLRDLATRSTLTTEATTMGQRIKLLDERNPDSPVKAIRDVVKAREARAKSQVKDIAKARQEIAKEVDGEIKKVVAKKQTWTEFIRSIQC